MNELETESSRTRRRRRHLSDDLSSTQVALHSAQDDNSRLRNTLFANTDPRRDERMRMSIDVSDRLIRYLRCGVSDLREAIVGDHQR
jgi:hypothetical protein